MRQRFGDARELSKRAYKKLTDNEALTSQPELRKHESFSARAGLKAARSRRFLPLIRACRAVLPGLEGSVVGSWDYRWPCVYLRWGGSLILRILLSKETFAMPCTIARLARPILMLVLVLGVWLAGTSRAAAQLDAQTMRSALRTATPEEEGFIDHVLTLVDQGRLPRALVESTFQWARKKPRHRFQYFRYGLILRAAQEGIAL